MHQTWLRSQHFEQAGLRVAYREALDAVMACADRRDRLDAAIAEMAYQQPWAQTVARLECVRGIATLTAFGLTVEIGDWHRFTGATIGAYLGLVPSEFSTGASRSQGPITKAGNTHARRLLVEAAWHHRKTYHLPGATMRARWQQAAPAASARGHAGNQRLHQRWQSFTARSKKPVVANVAIARELAGWCWSL
ncbi:MAG: transposase, partial [Pseudonocardiaceae bacterium]